jgi:hypothetical protein
MKVQSTGAHTALIDANAIRQNSWPTIVPPEDILSAFNLAARYRSPE